MKRVISIILLGLGVGMMLVHSLVPHHHHNGEVCFVEAAQVCCQHSNGNHHDSSHNRSHDQSCNLLNDLTQAEKFRVIDITQVISNHNVVKDFFANLNRCIDTAVRLELSQRIYISGISNTWQIPIISCHTLRAPPF